MPTLADVEWSRFDFIDLGSSKGGSLRYCQRRFGARRGLGVDLDAAKVQQTLDAGFDAVLADAAQIEGTNFVRFVSMMDFLEHLPGLEVVEAVLARAAVVASDFLFIKHPSFEGEGSVEELGVRQYWWDWTGHKAHPKVADYRRMLDGLGVDRYAIRYEHPIRDSSDPTLIPTGMAKNQHAYDPAIHPPKPQVEFRDPLWRSQEIVVALRPLTEQEWSRIVTPTSKEGRVDSILRPGVRSLRRAGHRAVRRLARGTRRLRAAADGARR